MSVTLTCYFCGRESTNTGEFYALIIRNVFDPTDEKLTCQICSSCIEKYITGPISHKDDPKREPQKEKPTTKPKKVAEPEETILKNPDDVYIGMELREFLRTPRAQNDMYMLQVFDNNGVEIMDFNDCIRNTVLDVSSDSENEITKIIIDATGAPTPPDVDYMEDLFAEG
jgi:hypothetical protein